MVTEITVVGAGGEYMETVSVVEWLAKAGDAVKAGDVIVVVETAKAATEIEAPASGILSEIRAEVGSEVEVGGILGLISDGASSTDPAAPGSAATNGADTPHAAIAAGSGPAPKPSTSTGSGRVIATPLARRVARQRGIDLATVVPGSKNGRIRFRDVVAASEGGEAQPKSPVADKAELREGLYVQIRKGEGTPLVFLHGFGADSAAWSPLHARLRGCGPIVTVDLPSHGRSQAVVPQDIEEIATKIAGALAAEGLEKVHLVGHSLGGAAAAALVGQKRLDVRSLTLIAPAGLGPEINGEFLNGFLRAGQAESVASWLRCLVADPALVTPAFVETVLQTRRDTDQSSAQRALAGRIFPDGVQVSDYRYLVASLHLPVKVIWGQEDRIIPWRHGLALGGMVALHLLPRVGHVPHLEDADLVATVIRNFVRGVQ